MGCWESSEKSKRILKLEITNLPQHGYKFIGEPENNLDYYFGASAYSSKINKFCFIGYHSICTSFGYGKFTDKLGVVQYIGFVKEQKPIGYVRTIYDSQSQYEGLMNEKPNGKGQFLNSSSASKSLYRGYWEDGMKHYRGEEKTNSWYYIGLYENDKKGPFGKYKAITNNNKYVYIGEYFNEQPEGTGIMKLKYYNNKPLLHGQVFSNKCTKTINIVGIFENGKPVEGIEEIHTEAGTLTRDIRDKSEPTPTIIHEAGKIKADIINTYSEIYHDLHDYQFKELIENGYQIEVIKNCISHVHLKLISCNMIKFFCKGRLCGILDDVALASYEYYILSFLKQAFTKYMDRYHIEIQLIFPEAFSGEKVCSGGPHHIVFDDSPSPNLMEKASKKLVPSFENMNPEASLYYLTFLEYLEENNFLHNLIIATEMTIPALCLAYYKSLEALKLLESFGFYKGKIKLSNIHLRYQLISEEIQVRFTDFSNSRFFSGNKLVNKWVELTKLKKNIQTQTLNFNHKINEHLAADLKKTEKYYDFIVPGEFDQIESQYMPATLKKLQHSINLEDRVLEAHVGSLCVFSFCMAFLKSFVMIQSFSNNNNEEYKRGEFYELWKELKILKTLKNPKSWRK